LFLVITVFYLIKKKNHLIAVRFSHRLETTDRFGPLHDESLNRSDDHCRRDSAAAAYISAEQQPDSPADVDVVNKLIEERLALVMLGEVYGFAIIEKNKAIADCTRRSTTTLHVMR